jgi:hypothetical protein
MPCEKAVYGCERIQVGADLVAASVVFDGVHVLDALLRQSIGELRQSVAILGRTRYCSCWLRHGEIV